MRGEDAKQEAIFSYLSPEKRVPAEHPLRPVRRKVDTILQEMSPRFGKLYSEVGRPSIAPERLLNEEVAEAFLQRGGSVIDERTTRHAGYAISQQKRKRIVQSFGWMKINGMLKKVKLRGLEKVRWLFTFVGAAHNLYWMGRLEAKAG